jgi:hypothetical protein
MKISLMNQFHRSTAPKKNLPKTNKNRGQGQKQSNPSSGASRQVIARDKAEAKNMGQELLDVVNEVVDLADTLPLDLVPIVGQIYPVVKSAVKGFNKLAPKLGLPSLPGIIRHLGSLIGSK